MFIKRERAQSRLFVTLTWYFVFTHSYWYFNDFS